MTINIYTVKFNGEYPSQPVRYNGREYKSYRQIIEEYGDDWNGCNFLMEDSNNLVMYSKVEVKTTNVWRGSKKVVEATINGVSVKLPETVVSIITKYGVSCF